MLCDTFNSLEKDLIESFYCIVSEQTLPGETSWPDVAEMITALLIFYINIVIQAKKKRKLKVSCCLRHNSSSIPKVKGT